jgi:hypothetical protein
MRGGLARNERKKKLRSTHNNSVGGSTMDRDTLLLRVSLIWLAIVTVGCVDVLFIL